MMAVFLDEGRFTPFILITVLGETLFGKGLPKRSIDSQLSVRWCVTQLNRNRDVLQRVLRSIPQLALEGADVPLPLSQEAQWKLMAAPLREALAVAASSPRYLVVNSMMARKQGSMGVGETTSFDAVLEACAAYKSAYLKIGNAAPPPPSLVAPDPLLPGVFACTPSYRTDSEAPLIHQDRGSALPAALLARGQCISNAADLCASPGNKTIQLLSLMMPRSTVLAVEVDSRRAETLAKRLEQAGAAVHLEVDSAYNWRNRYQAKGFLSAPHRASRSVTQGESRDASVAVVHLGSCLDLSTSQDLHNVTHILVDPTCSSSGMLYNQDRSLAELVASTPVPTRLGIPQPTAQKHADPVELSAFQYDALCVALDSDAHRVVYSTCSIHAEENEDVVARALLNHSEWHLVDPMPEWPMRGVPSAQLPASSARLCYRAGPQTSCSGIFAAVFERDEGMGELSLLERCDEGTEPLC